MDNPDLPNIEGKGVAPVRIDAIDQLADIYLHERTKYNQARMRLDDARMDLIEAMHQHEEELSVQAMGEPDAALVYRLPNMTLISVMYGKEQLKVIEPK
jgi:hypothetical protein